MKTPLRPLFELHKDFPKLVKFAYFHIDCTPGSPYYMEDKARQFMAESVADEAFVWAIEMEKKNPDKLFSLAYLKKKVYGLLQERLANQSKLAALQNCYHNQED